MRAMDREHTGIRDFQCAPCMTNQTDSASSDDDMGNPEEIKGKFPQYGL